MLTRKNLIFIGAPGAGKGTYSELLTAQEPLAHVSTGDLLRDEIKRGTELGMAAEKVMKTGGLVSDDIVCGMVKARLSRPDADNGFILDGFPRTIRQAEMLNQVLAELGKKLDCVVYLNIPDPVVIQRLTSRILCRKCGKIYNRIYMPPKHEGVCDDCGGEIYQRSDDSEATAVNRLKVFHENTRPLIDFYRRAGLLFELTAEDKKEGMAKLMEALR